MFGKHPSILSEMFSDVVEEVLCEREGIRKNVNSYGMFHTIARIEVPKGNIREISCFGILRGFIHGTVIEIYIPRGGYMENLVFYNGYNRVISIKNVMQSAHRMSSCFIDTVSLRNLYNSGPRTPTMRLRSIGYHPIIWWRSLLYLRRIRIQWHVVFGGFIRRKPPYSYTLHRYHGAFVG